MKNCTKEEFGRFGDIIEAIQSMSADEFRASLVRAGIISENDQLTEKYKRGTNVSKRVSGKNGASS